MVFELPELDLGSRRRTYANKPKTPLMAVAMQTHVVETTKLAS
jgi:hypothetical protein